MNILERRVGHQSVRRFENDSDIRRAIEEDSEFRNQLKAWIRAAEDKTPSPTELVHRRQMEEAEGGGQ